METFILLAAVMSLNGCATPEPKTYTGPTRDIIVNVTCSDPHARFYGMIMSDGEVERFVGIGHGEFPAHGHEFVCSFQKSDEAGKISVSISEAGKNLGDSSTGSPTGGVRAEMLQTAEQQHTLFSTFN